MLFIRRFFIFCCLLALSAFVAYKASGSRLNIPTMLQAIIEHYQLPIELPELLAQHVTPRADQQLPKEPVAPVQQPILVKKSAVKAEPEMPKENLPSYYCKAREKVEVKRATGSKVYKWVDKNGVTHFGDNRASNNKRNVDTISFSGRMDYFDLAIKSGEYQVPYDYKDRLTVHVNKAYSTLSYLLPKNLLQKVNVNLWVFNSKREYETFKNEHAPSLGGASSGFHSARNNIAAALRYSDEQLLETSVHEAVHVMNAGMFGNIPRWLNEGLAEYFESMKVYGQAMEVGADKRWLSLIDKTSDKMPLQYLLSSDYRHWNADQRNYFYAYSWALVYFLLEKPEGKAMLLDYLKASAQDPCVRVDSYDYFDQHYSGGVRRMENRFHSWLLDDRVSHQY